MVKRILLATDGSDAARNAASVLASLPLPTGTEIRVLYVLDPLIERLLERAQTGEKHFGRHVVHDAEAVLAREGLTVHGELRTGDAAHEILTEARSWGADLVVVGASGQSALQSFMLGSVARNVAKHAPCSVLLCREQKKGLRSIVIGTDGSENAQRAVELAAQFPLPEGATIRLVHVLRPQAPLSLAMSSAGMVQVADASYYELLREAANEEERRATQLLAAQATVLGTNASTALRSGDPATELIAEAKERDADLIVVGARGVSVIEGLLTGSVADRILRRAPATVLLVR